MVGCSFVCQVVSCVDTRDFILAIRLPRGWGGWLSGGGVSEGLSYIIKNGRGDGVFLKSKSSVSFLLVWGVLEIILGYMLVRLRTTLSSYSGSYVLVILCPKGGHANYIL